MSCTTLLVNKGGIQRLMEVNNNQYMSLVGRIRLRANGRNIVVHQLPTLLDVTCFVRLHTLLHVVGSCCVKLESGQTFESTTPNISVVP